MASEMISANTAHDEEGQQEQLGDEHAEPEGGEHETPHEEQQPQPEPQPSVSAIKSSIKPKGSYYQTHYQTPREFEFRMSGTKAQGLACGPAQRGLLHHVVLPADHPAACPILIDDAMALTTAKLLEAGVHVKMDNRMEKSFRSMVSSCLHSAKEPSQLSQREEVQAIQNTPEDFIPNYERLIVALKTNANVQRDAIMEALHTLQEAVKNKTEITGEKFKKILEMCLELSYVDHKQTAEFVNRMKSVNTLTEAQAVAVLNEAEKKFVNGKIQLITLQRIIENYGMKGSKGSKGSNRA